MRFTSLLCLFSFGAPLVISASIPSPPTVYLIRHGEKPPDPEDSGLNADGFKRAECLRDLFGVTSPYSIGHVMAPKINSRGQHRRSYETVFPVATDLSLPVDTSCKRNRVECVAQRIREFKGTGNILISWRHSKMREIVQALGYDDPPEYPDERFDLIWTIPYPYDNITDIRSERCPGLDVRAVNNRAETERQDFNLPTQFFRGIAGLRYFDRALPKDPSTSSTLSERLRSHAQAFDGLLSLIPAKFYYGEDGSDQWKRKKQTKEQAREAKRAKLDPDSAKSAKDVMDENARKRKRDEERNEDDSSDGGELGSELPKEGLKRGDATTKKQKQAEDSANPDRTPAKSAEDAEARKKLKEEKKAQKKASQKEKKKVKEAARKAKVAEQQPTETKTPAAEAAQKSELTPASKTKDQDQKDDDSDDDESVDGVPAEELSLDFSAEQEEQPSSSASTPNSGFDASNPQSGSSSISSIIPPRDSTVSSSSEPKPLKATPDELKQRLQKRLDELRAARHADGLNGKPARNRQELIEARRQKAEQRKAHKKELRQKAREEEQRAKDEAMARRFSPGGSGSLLASPRSPADSVGSNNNFAFGRVVFADGQHADPTLSNVREQHKSQGPKDPAATLKAVEAKKAKLAAMDDEKRADIEEKDMWLNAKKRAHGERVRDDTSLLKKALKRKETAKKKSEREWKERLDAVKKGKDMRQQKREENLRKRREEKGKGGGGGKKQTGGKKKSRPGFEGSFKAKSGGKK
ncbi:putative 60S ribosome biogenesis protein Rrp14 [Aspergillus ibericus CBS 121593]|uniref:SURF6-domain-containing protein n=1 Tax=Aspergillus ibericus CBS 121593 TaxID=1448316 RepID=A0A395GSB9_9EURO|nr:SURF6-domain-containing protein [Aspergillus ibericus CBS 121593]RAK98425.1 SURF6-domain-containing protein [Aspergillus ibericus CBS 121593]